MFIYYIPNTTQTGGNEWQEIDFTAHAAELDMFLFSMYLLSMLLVQLGSSVKLAGFLLNMDTINQIVAVVGILLGTQKKYALEHDKKKSVSLFLF